MLFASGTIGENAAEALPVTVLANKAVLKKAVKKVVKRKPTRRPATRPTVPTTIAQPVTPPPTAAPTTAAPTTPPPIPPVSEPTLPRPRPRWRWGRPLSLVCPFSGRPSSPAPAGSTTNTPIGFQALTAAAPTVSLAIGGLAGGVSAIFVPNPTFGATTLVLTVSVNVSSATYPLTITATAGAATKTYTASLQINLTGTYGLSAAPAALSIARGGSAASVVTFVTSGGFASPTTFVASAIPAPTTYGLTAGASSVTFTVAVPFGTPVGVYPATITGTSGTLTASVVISVTVT